MQSKCEATVHVTDGCAIVALHGEVDGSAAGTLGTAYDEAVRTGSPATLLLDFAAVDYINSTGIALIVSILGRARAEGRSVVASGLSDHYRQIFTITRLSDFIQLYDDVAAATAGLTVG